jgi:hypothetical protein
MVDRNVHGNKPCISLFLQEVAEIPEMVMDIDLMYIYTPIRRSLYIRVENVEVPL